MPIPTDLIVHYSNLLDAAVDSAFGIEIECEPNATRTMLYRVRNLYDVHGRWGLLEIRQPPRDSRRKLWIRKKKADTQPVHEPTDDLDPELANALEASLPPPAKFLTAEDDLDD